MELVRRPAVEFEIAGQRQRVGFCLAQRLAHVQRLEPGELVGLLQHQPPHARQQPAALGGGHAAPGAGQRVACRRDGPVDIGRAAASDARELGAVGGFSSDSVSLLAAERHSPAMKVWVVSKGMSDIGAFLDLACIVASNIVIGGNGDRRRAAGRAFHCRMGAARCEGAGAAPFSRAVRP